jgi:tRNA(Ile)-lysidine synthase
VAVVHAAIAAALADHVLPTASIAVALSGGIDSMVLLDALALLARDRGIDLSAVHVNHGISPYAAHWATFCAEQCALRGVALVTRTLTLRLAHSSNLEAVAREARYRALREIDADVIALAHHANDQAETVLLQLLRGAGPRGLAAMARFLPGVPALWRPLLDLRGATLAAYAAERGIAWIADESNADTHHRRNFLRHEIAPALAARFPGFPATLSRAAALQAEASELLDALADDDAQGAVVAGKLDGARLSALSPPRARNLLRWFLHRHGLRSPSSARLADMLRQLVAARPDARTRIHHDGSEIGCHRGLIVVHMPTPPPFAQAWHGEAEVHLPGGTLAFAPTRGSGMAAELLARHPVVLRPRTGGERLQTTANRPRRALKKLLQDAGVPEWQRQGLPLVWCGDQIAAVPGIGVDRAVQAAAGEAGWAGDWRPTLPR